MSHEPIRVKRNLLIHATIFRANNYVDIGHTCVYIRHMEETPMMNHFCVEYKTPYEDLSTVLSSTMEASVYGVSDEEDAIQTFLYGNPSFKRSDIVKCWGVD